MTASEHEDFVRQLFQLVHEEAPAWEIEHGSIDRTAAGHEVHGPWQRTDCAAVLVRWAQGGLLGIMSHEGWPGRNTRKLPASQVDQILSAPDDWPKIPLSDEAVWWSLHPTDRGLTRQPTDWIALATPTTDDG